MATISTDTMTLKNRTELKSLFKNNSHLSASQFAELITSLLNKRDDQFHGVWKPGQTYQKGDVVYYEGALWEMKAEKEICAQDGQQPGKSADWKSRLKELEEKVDKIQHDLQALSKEFTEYKQQMELRLQQLLKYLTLLTLGIAIALVWLFGGSIYHLFTGAA
jgi:uncharacterized coiled-coil protein SlyX